MPINSFYQCEEGCLTLFVKSPSLWSSFNEILTPRGLRPSLARLKGTATFKCTLYMTAYSQALHSPRCQPCQIPHQRDYSSLDLMSKSLPW